MSSTQTAQPRHGRSGRAPRTTNLLVGAVGVLGELMITLGVLIFAFLVWQLWWTDVQGNRAQAEVVSGLTWQTPPTVPDGSTTGPVIAAPRRDAPPVDAEPEHATTFATLQVPRWDGEPERPVSQGVERSTVLDVLGIGHYPATAMPGGIGNFALAGHRTTYAKPFHRIAELQEGDPIVIRTESTWYVYRVTSTSIVSPSDVDVIAPVPGDPTAEPTERLITLTSCHPMFSARERIIVHGTLDYWAPVADGIPAELAGGA
ncbi:class E sortase [Cellulomonas sp. P22]|uniref:class E sortase n=1 Tax=Cellulomonas sp. P22 TaxID=3373189 RepID=UPI0037B8A080